MHPDSMILLGSIQRLELIKTLERQVGRERRLQVLAQWHKEAQERYLWKCKNNTIFKK